ncbi:TonB-dependent siderophore receptor [Paracoccus sp. CPCC 101403]|uniref:TonB-dependent siderophore receptor n=2 Tax=Paracoccus broussonetiae TaxID=3075834 RepID=A0ABU3EJ44_9RHOB|nr:TonB-dependent siderophore receptor [Paracoccus sp. CPCC 101403]MDT1064135.1 TonB-dependent siderophore receptor [Paracoccus sp. CPCC 101403]
MSVNYCLRALASTSVLALSANLSVAQDAQVSQSEPVVTLDAVVLTATTDTQAAADGYVATYSQIATKSDVPIAETQQSISVVTNQQIRDQGAENLGQALGYTAGVLAEPFGKDPRFDTPYVRGFRAEDAQYVNGLRQGRYFGAIGQEIYGIQQIEVLRGPSSSLYGAGSPLGVINMVQKRAQSYDFGEVGVGYDSNNSSQLFFDVNRAPSADLAWRITGIGRDDQTQIEDLTDKGGYLAGAVRWTPDDATTIDFLATYTKDAPMPPTGVPFALTGTGHDEYLRELYTGQKDWDDSNRKAYSFGVEISHEFDNGWTLNQGFRYESLDWDYRTTYASAVTGPTTFSRGSSEQLENSDTVSIDTRLNGEVVTGQATHKLLFGMDVRKYDAHESSQFFTAADLDWQDPDYYIDARTPYGPPNAGPSLLRQAGIYAQDEIEYGNWRGSFGLRYDWVEQTGERYGTVSEYKENKVTGRAGLAYVFDNGAVPYITYSTSFDPQAGVDLDNNVLRPTEGKQWEAGVKYQPQSFEGLITLAVYDLRQTNVNRAVQRPDGPGSGIRQIGEVRSQGIELEATAEIAEGWKLRGGYAYNKTEQMAPDGDPVNGKELPDAPNHLASLWVDRDFGNGLRAGGGIRYIGSRFKDATNSAELDDVTLVDLGGSYTWNSIETSINVTNLTDEVYVGACGFSYCAYGEGRTITAKVAYKF